MVYLSEKVRKKERQTTAKVSSFRHGSNSF